MAHNRLYFWLRKKYGKQVKSICQMTEKTDSQNVADDIEKMNELLFASSGPKTEAWQGHDLIRHIADMRKSKQPGKVRSRKKNPFESLNF